MLGRRIQSCLWRCIQIYVYWARKLCDLIYRVVTCPFSCLLSSFKSWAGVWIASLVLTFIGIFIIMTLFDPVRTGFTWFGTASANGAQGLGQMIRGGGN